MVSDFGRPNGLGDALYDQLVGYLAAEVVYLASDDCAYMTGATVAVDGGLTL